MKSTNSGRISGIKYFFLSNKKSLAMSVFYSLRSPARGSGKPGPCFYFQAVVTVSFQAAAA